MAAKKTELFVDKPHLQCAGSPGCRFPGRLWVRSLSQIERLCINHYYIAIEKDHSLASDEVPQKPADNKTRAAGG